MQSYKKRYEGREEEVKQDVRELGEIPSQEKWGAKDYVGWKKYIEQIMPGEKVAVVTDNVRSTPDELYERIVTKITDKLVAQEIRIRELEDKIKKYQHFEELKQKESNLQAVRLLNAIQ